MTFDETRDNLTDIEANQIEADAHEEAREADHIRNSRHIRLVDDPTDPEHDEVGDADTDYDIEFDGGGYFNLSEIPEDGVTSVDLFDSKGRKLFSFSVSTNGVAYQVLQAGEDAGLFTTTEDEV